MYVCCLYKNLFLIKKKIKNIFDVLNEKCSQKYYFINSKLIVLYF